MPSRYSYQLRSHVSSHLDHPSLHILRQPSYAITIALAHDNRAHEHFDGTDALELNLALACRLVHAQLVSQLILRNSLGVIDLVAQDDEGNLGKLLHREEGVELGLGLGESLVVLRIDEEDDTVNLREVIPPDTASCDL